MHKDIKAELRAANVFAEVASSVSLVQSLVQGFDAREEFATAVDVGCARAKSPSGNDKAFNQAVRIFEHEEVVLKGTAFAFVSVYDNVNRLARTTRHKAPLHASREACTTASAEVRTLHVIDELKLAHVEQAFRNVRVATQFLVDFDVLGALAKVLRTNFYTFSHN